MDNHIYRLRFVFAFALLASLLSAQKGYKFEYGGILGMSNYLGEIGGKSESARPFIWDMKLAKTRWDLGAYAKYKLHRYISARVAAHYLRIAGEDRLSTNPGRKYRNLSFRNDIFDLESTIHLHFYQSDYPMGIYTRTKVYFTSYVFVGIGAFVHNPKTKYGGEWIALRPVRTEGQSNPYSWVGACVPFGAGFTVTMSKRRRMHRLSLEVNWRKTFTDHLDDISADRYENNTGYSALQKALNNRNPELKNQPVGFEQNYGWQGYKADGTTPANAAPRGNSKDLDSYISLNVSYGISIKGKYSRSKRRKVARVRF
jgi:hypothetical protein